ncbi:MAG: sulfatase-like hydrolase/transferase [Bacteroidota bacterium]
MMKLYFAWVPFLSIMLFSCDGNPSQQSIKESNQRPNIILMVADDMGYGEISSYGGSEILTPHLTKLARSGMQFTQFYSAGSVCTPTRISILTGRYPHRFGMNNTIFGDNGGCLPDSSSLTIAEILQKEGYSTAHMGKWHLGGVRGIDLTDRNNMHPDADPGPHEHGFDYYQCQVEDRGRRSELIGQKLLYRKGGTVLARNDQKVSDTDPYFNKHWTDCNGDFAIDMINKLHTKNKPFFLNVWWYVPHTPIEPAPEPYYSRAKEDTKTYQRPMPDKSRHNATDYNLSYSSMISHLDHKVGLIVQRLEELGIRDNTVIIFTSDNGGAWGAFNGGLLGGKACYYEGGIRVPGFVSWPDKIKSNITTDFIGHSNDILPTICSMAGVSIPASTKIDGIDLLPVLLKNEVLPEREALFWVSDRRGKTQRYIQPPLAITHVVRENKWKLACYQNEPVALFDLDNDPVEEKNLIDLPEHKDRISRLHSKLLEHLAEPSLPRPKPDNRETPYIIN